MPALQETVCSLAERSRSSRIQSVMVPATRMFVNPSGGAGMIITSVMSASLGSQGNMRCHHPSCV